MTTPATEPTRQSTLGRTQSAFNTLFARLLPTTDLDSPRAGYPALPTLTPRMPGGFLVDTATPRVTANPLEDATIDPDDDDAELGRLANSLKISDETGASGSHSQSVLGLAEQPGTPTETDVPAPHTNLPPAAPPPSRNTFSSSQTRSLPPDWIVLAHDSSRQRLWDALAFGTLFEVARITSRPDGPSVQSIRRETIEQLAGPNHPFAAKVDMLLSNQPAWAQVMTSRGAPSPALAWATELDQEQAALVRGNGGGMGAGIAEGTWYGGKVSFRGVVHLSDDPTLGRFRVALLSPECGASYSYARYHGSRRFLRLRLAQEVGKGKGGDLAEVYQWAHRPILIFGRVFRAFIFKDGVIHYVETDVDVDRRQNNEDADHLRLSLLAWLQEGNPLETNRHQLMCKWADRFRLGLSTSVPGCEVDEMNIKVEEDIMAEIEPPPDGKFPPESIMTDGNGLVSGSLMRVLAQKLKWEETPATIQMRLAGFKGTLTLASTESFKSPLTITFRHSQRKIDFPLSESWKRVLHVVAPSTVTQPAHLSSQYLRTLSHGGVSNRIVHQYLEAALTEEVEQLTVFDMSPVGRARLYSAIMKAGGVQATRLRRLAGSSSRAMGYGRDWEQEENEEDQASFASSQSSTSSADAWTRDETSGCPTANEEILMLGILSGFDLRQSNYFSGKWRAVISKVIQSFILKFRIPVPKSATAFVIPDPAHVLRPGEIYFALSRPLVDAETGLSSGSILGDVLVMRHPCMLPTDIQKVRAVFRPELAYLKDVIVFPVRGERSLASMLAGGDLDGDTVTIIWDPSLVDEFANADPRLADMPDGFRQDNFERQSELGTDFLKRTENFSDEDKERELQRYLLAPITDTHEVGLYSLWHDISAYKHGLDHRKTLRLGRMFSFVIDASKSGLRVKPKVLADDKREFDCQPPRWRRLAADLKEKFDENKGKTPSKSQHRQGNLLPTKPLVEGNLLDSLMNFAISEKDRHLVAVDRLVKGANPTDENGMFYLRDDELWDPYHRADQAALHDTHIRDELELVKDSVQEIFDRYKFIIKIPRGRMPFNIRQEHIRELSLSFSESPEPATLPRLSLDPESLRRLKASYAYQLDMKNSFSGRGTAFPWEMAMQSLCAIKATATSNGRAVTVPVDLADGMAFLRSFTK